MTRDVVWQGKAILFRGDWGIERWRLSFPKGEDEKKCERAGERSKKKRKERKSLSERSSFFLLLHGQLGAPQLSSLKKKPCFPPPMRPSGPSPRRRSRRTSPRTRTGSCASPRRRVAAAKLAAEREGSEVRGRLELTILIACRMLKAPCVHFTPSPLRHRRRLSSCVSVVLIADAASMRKKKSTGVARGACETRERVVAGKPTSKTIRRQNAFRLSLELRASSMLPILVISWLMV